MPRARFGPRDHETAGRRAESGEERLCLNPIVQRRRGPMRIDVTDRFRGEAPPLERANDALDRLRRGELRGAAVLTLD